MNSFSHTFVNFDPLASSLLGFAGLRNAKLNPVFLQIAPVDLTKMTWEAAKALSASAKSFEIDGPSEEEFEDAVKASFHKGEEFRQWLIALPRTQKMWTQNGVHVAPDFEGADFTYVVDVYTALLVEEFPSNPDWQLELEACVAPLSLAVLVLIDVAMSAVGAQQEDLARIATVTAISLSARSKQIPKMLSRSPQTLSKLGGIAKNKKNNYLADFARGLYAVRNVKEEFANPKAAARAIRAEVEAEAKRLELDYSEENFGDTLYKWLRDAKRSKAS